MKVLYSMIYAAEKGGSGAPTYTLHLLKGLKARSIDTGIVFSTSESYEAPAVDYEVYPLRFARPAIFDSQPSVGASIAFKDMTSAQSAEAIDAFAKSFRAAHHAGYTLSHVQHGMYIGYAAALVKRELGLPYIVSLHVMEINFIEEFPDPILAMAGMVHANRIVALTEANKRRLLETYRRTNIVKWDSLRKGRSIEDSDEEYRRLVGDKEIDPENVVVIPLGIDTTHFDIRDDLPIPDDLAELVIADDASVVLYAARLVPMKGVLHLLEAAKRYGAAGNVRTIVLGGGILSDRVRDECRSFANVHYLGFKSQDELPAYYNALARHSSVFCVPSRSEGLSVAYLEAMACGMRIVASCYEDMGEMDIMAPPWASFVPFGQVDSLANEISRVLSTNAAASRHEIRARVTPYSKAPFISRVCELYESVISEASHGGETCGVQAGANWSHSACVG